MCKHRLFQLVRHAKAEQSQLLERRSEIRSLAQAPLQENSESPSDCEMACYRYFASRNLVDQHEVRLDLGGERDGISFTRPEHIRKRWINLDMLHNLKPGWRR
jgi:hypothetical protein